MSPSHNARPFACHITGYVRLLRTKSIVIVIVIVIICKNEWHALTTTFISSEFQGHEGHTVIVSECAIAIAIVYTHRPQKWVHQKISEAGFKSVCPTFSYTLVLDIIASWRPTTSLLRNYDVRTHSCEACKGWKITQYAPMACPCVLCVRM